jgi:hypothetical protein
VQLFEGGGEGFVLEEDLVGAGGEGFGGVFAEAVPAVDKTCDDNERDQATDERPAGGATFGEIAGEAGIFGVFAGEGGGGRGGLEGE